MLPLLPPLDVVHQPRLLHCPAESRHHTLQAPVARIRRYSPAFGRSSHFLQVRCMQPCNTKWYLYAGEGARHSFEMFYSTRSCLSLFGQVPIIPRQENLLQLHAAGLSAAHWCGPPLRLSALWSEAAFGVGGWTCDRFGSRVWSTNHSIPVLHH